MANLVDKSGDAYSNVVHGDGSNSLTFTMPGNVALDVESVVATVDNSAGGDTTALLTVKDPSGRVIATKRQGATVDAGASGTATWALRLTDEVAGGRNAQSVGFYNAEPVGGNPVPSGTHSTRMALTFAGTNAGVDLLGTFAVGPFGDWWVKTPGFYCFMARIGIDPSPNAVWGPGEIMKLDIGPVAADPAPAHFWATQATSTYPLNNTDGAAINTISVVRFMPTYDNALINNFYFWELVVTWSHIGDVNVSGFVEAIQLG